MIRSKLWSSIMECAYNYFSNDPLRFRTLPLVIQKTIVILELHTKVVGKVVLQEKSVKFDGLRLPSSTKHKSKNIVLSRCY